MAEDKRDRVSVDITGFRERIERLRRTDATLGDLSFVKAIRFLLRRGIEEEERDAGIDMDKGGDRP